jgi:hypothetical protein
VVPIIRGAEELRRRRQKFVALAASLGLLSVISVAAIAWRLWK